MNTYADGIGFLGAVAGLEYFYEAAEIAIIDVDVADYMAVLKVIIILSKNVVTIPTT